MCQSVCLSVFPDGVLLQNDWLDLDVIGGGVSGVGRGMSVLDGDGDHKGEGAVLEVNVVHTIVTNGDFVA